GEVIDRDDVGVHPHAGGRLGLALEALAQIGELAGVLNSEGGAERLDGDEAADLSVVSADDITEAAAAEGGLRTVAPKDEGRGGAVESSAPVGIPGGVVVLMDIAPAAHRPSRRIGRWIAGRVRVADWWTLYTATRARGTEFLTRAPAWHALIPGDSYGHGDV